MDCTFLLPNNDNITVKYYIKLRSTS